MHPRLWLLLLTGFLLRLILSAFGTLELDFNTYLAWSNRLVESGFSTFYQIWSDYLPGYMYVLWFLGQVKLIFPALPTVVLYKLPAILADVVSAYLIFKLVARRLPRGAALRGYPLVAISAAAAYLFNPAIWANSTLWGQTDSLVALAALLWFYWRQNHFYLASITLGLGLAIKPTLILLTPFAISHMPLALIAFILTFLPFSPSLPQLPGFVFTRLFTTAGQYPYTSVHAFNLWQLIHGSWHSDAQFQVLGWLLFAGISFLFLLKAKFRITPRLLAGVFLAAFLLLTRMHERHLLPALPFLLLTSPGLYVWFSLSYLLNLRFSYVAVTTAYQSQFLPLIATRILSLLNLIGLGLLFFRFKFKFPRLPRLPQLPKSSWSISLVASRYALVAILLFSLFTRLYRLHLPEKFYFDEVYHAFTATEMLRGNPQAWEWWNPNPPDVAYEWTHPPLAKEFMIAGMWLFGPNSFGWRFPAAILGVANIFLVYLFTRRLFNSPTIAILASALFSLDGLNLVQSRIGMNDTYLLFFLLLTLLLFLKQKYFFSSLTFGLALASKWSAVYLLPVLFLTRMILVRPKKTLLLAISYLPLAAAIYLAAYLPFFTSGHSFKQFVELHQQMYWYHTKLVATHPYQSSALTWPLNLRPVWYYVDYQDTTVANIYALGNPLIFWSGLLAVIYSLFAIRYKPILLLVASYLSLFLPWIFSPRIMFLYHYLPATPFMVILLAWVLTRIGFKFAICYLLLAIGLFLFFYPLWTATPVPSWLGNLYFWLPSWR